MKMVVMLILFLILLVGLGSAGTSYYVKNGGNDSLDGKSDATAWRTLDRVDSLSDAKFFKEGDDVYFKCGDKWKPSTHLSVEWNGSEVDDAIIGAYYIESGQIKTNGCGVYERPIIEGIMKTDKIDQPGGVPGSKSAAMIDVVYEYGSTGISYAKYKRNVIVQDLHILNSNGLGVKLYGVDYGKIRRIKVENSMSAGILMKYCNINYSRKDTIPTYNENVIGGFSRSIIEDCETVNDNYGPLIFDTNQGAGIVAVQSRNVLIRRNYVHEGHGEAIGVYNNAGNYDHIGYSIIEDNVVFDMFHANIYISNANHNIIRRNLVYNTGRPNYAITKTETRRWGGSGIGITNEEGDGNQKPRQVDYNYVYNNLVANTGACFGMGTQWNKSWTGEFQDIISNVKFFNNICVGNRNGFGIGQYGAVDRGMGNEIKNNIFLMTGDSEYQFRGYAPVNTAYLPSGEAEKGTQIDNNLYSSNPNQTTNPYICGGDWHCERISGPNDPPYAVANLSKKSKWNNLTAEGLTFEDFRLLPGSPGIDAGEDLSNFFNVDFNGIKRPQGVGWDIGAFEYVSGMVSVCGNNLTESGEICDGTNLNGQNCSSIDTSFVSGNLSCFLNCSGYDVSRCVVGNGTCSVRLSNINEKMNDWQNGKCVLGDVIALIRQWVAEGKCD